MNITKAQALIARRMDGLSVLGLGFSDLFILYLIRQAPGQKLRRIDLAEKTGLTASGITRLLLPLEKTGFIARAAHARDARVSLVTLTDAGGQILQESIQIANALALEILPEDQLQAGSSFTDLLKLLGANIS